MTHDPLCPKWFDTYNDQMECPTCDLIAKVRENERERCATAVSCWTDPVHEDGERNMVFVDEAVYQIMNPSEGHPDWCLCELSGRTTTP